MRPPDMWAPTQSPAPPSTTISPPVMYAPEMRTHVAGDGDAAHGHPLADLLHRLEIAAHDHVVRAGAVDFEEVAERHLATPVVGGELRDLRLPAAHEPIRTDAVRLHGDRARFLTPQRHAGAVEDERRTRYASHRRCLLSRSRGTARGRVMGSPARAARSGTAPASLRSCPPRCVSRRAGRRRRCPRAWPPRPPLR